MYKKILSGLACLVMLILLLTCADVLETAQEKISQPPVVFAFPVTYFMIYQQPAQPDITLSWENPANADFSKTVLLRKAGSAPLSYRDNDAMIVYSGTNETVTDTDLIEGTTYYYTAYAKSKYNAYADGVTKALLVADVGGAKYAHDVLQFKAEQGENNREVVLTWNNPVDADFTGVKLVKSTTDFAREPDDGDAVVLHEGKYFRYTDSFLTPDTSYYYTIFCRNSDYEYSAGALALKSITESVIDIRRHSIFIFGGTTSYPATPQSFITAQVDMFDPLLETMTANVAVMPHPSYFCDAVAVNGKIYVMGGLDSTPAATTYVDIFDVDTLTWDTGTALPAARAAHELVKVGNQIYTVCGTSGATMANVVSDGFRYDSAGDTWYPADTAIYANLTTPRGALNAESFGGVIYYWGGTNSAGLALNTTSFYNTLNNYDVAGTIHGNMAYYRGSSSVLYKKRLDSGEEFNSLFLFPGGYRNFNSTTLPFYDAGNLLTYGGVYNRVFTLLLPNVNSTTVPAWNQLLGNSGALQVHRAYAGAEYHGDFIYVFGGLNADNPNNSIERLDVNKGNLVNAWTAVAATLPEAKYAFAIARLK